MALSLIIPILWRSKGEPIISYMILFKSSLIIHNLLVVVAIIVAGPFISYDNNAMFLLIVAQTILSLGALSFAGFLIGAFNRVPYLSKRLEEIEKSSVENE